MTGYFQRRAQSLDPNDFDALARVVVIGTSCAGKTTLARSLSEALSTPHIELDSLHWGPNWTPNPLEDFRAAVELATAQPRWVCDGNYHVVRDIVWRRASAVVWLNFPFTLVMTRALRRTWSRCINKSPLFAGNRESFGQSFFSRDSILLWVLRTHWKRQRELPTLLAESEHSHLSVIELRSPAESRDFLADVATASRHATKIESC